jgi:excisionase family DNA binding protein
VNENGHREPRWATVDEAAVYARCSPRTIRRWIHGGRLDAERMGPRRLMVDLNLIDAMRTPVVPTTTTRK